MIDLHLHVLPGIDDGASDLAEACEMCRMAAEDGCEALIVTPHQRHDRWENGDSEALEALLAEVQGEVGDTIQLHLGAEIRIDSDLLTDLERYPEAGITPLAGSRYLLLELDRRGIGPDPLHLAHEVRVAGWFPIFAHPEFIAPLVESPELVARLVDLGASMQVTAMSVTGEFGRRAQKYCQTLLDAGLVHFVSSDAHSTEWRPPGLSLAYREIAGRWGEETARRLTTTNPAAVLADQPLPVAVSG